MKTAFAIALFALCGCSSLTVIVDIGGTVNVVPVTKISDGDMTSGSATAEETNTNKGSLEIPLK